MKQQPCKKDCPRRTAGCGATCKDWKEYVEERNAGYEERVKKWKDEEIVFDGKMKSIHRSFARRRK